MVVVNKGGDPDEIPDTDDMPQLSDKEEVLNMDAIFGEIERIFTVSLVIRCIYRISLIRGGFPKIR